LRLVAGAVPLGRVDLWDSETFGDEERDALEQLLPWYALAFEAGRVRQDPVAASSAEPPAPSGLEAKSDVAEILGSIAAGRPIDGEDLLENVVRHLADHVGAHTAVVSQLLATTSGETGGGDAPAMKLRTAIAWKDGSPANNFDYDATGSPCANVLAGKLGCYPAEVCQQFLADKSLADSQTESYLGVPLFDREHHVIGVLSAWSRQTIAQPDEATALIRILARGAETELQYQSDLEAKKTIESRYRSLVATSHDLCAELSPERGLIEISPNVFELLGYTPSAFIDMPYQEIIHPGDLPVVTEIYREVQREGAKTSASVRVRHAAGNWCLFEANAEAYRAQDGELRVIVSACDITERATLEQEHAQMISIIQSSSDLIVLTALNGSVLFLNTAGQRLLGLASDEEALGKSLYDFVHPDATRSLKFEIMPAVHRHKQWTGELALQHFKTERRVTAVTSMFVVDDRRTHQPVAIAMICRDISDRRENERALLESEERYRMLADNPYELIAELDEDAHFIYASPNFETILGYSPEMLLGSHGFDLIHPDDRDVVAESFSSAVSQLTTKHGAYRAMLRDGSYRWLETTIRAYRTASSRTMAVLISRDVTDRVESDEALRQTQQKLLQSQKMDAIGRMAGGIAHDFNNLLTAITGYCDLLLEELGDQHPSRPDAEEILKASERAAGLTHQLLAFSRRQVLQMRILDLNNLVADMDRMLRRLIGEDVELVTLLDGTAWPVKADSGQLQQVLLNLVVNARDAMPRGGRITIETANIVLEEAVPTELDEIPAGDYLTLSVTDTGTGMSAEIGAMIFEPFFTTKESGKGTGLGLSTVIGIVQQCGGHIEVESEDGQGARFVIYLPKATEVPMLPERYLSPEQFHGSETIVVVEDSEPVRKLVVRCLDRHGYKVLEAISGIEALRFFSRHPGPIDLLLSDVILPKMDGFEIAKRAFKIRPETRVIYMSGFTDDALNKHGVRAEDIVLLEKPFTPSTLLRKVRQFLDSGAPADPVVESLAQDNSGDDSTS
jgi:PAS domain S-box-containing protein